MELREIVFRGKRLDNGEWVYGDVQHNYDHEPRCISDYCGSSPVDPSTVGQYTGIEDKNGKRIWEGDIVSFSSSDYMSFVTTGSVVFKKGSYGIEYFTKYSDAPCFHRIGQIDKWQDMSASGIMGYEYEIIGNIHDNLEELLGGSNG